MKVNNIFANPPLRSSGTTEDAACWRLIYTAVQPENNQDNDLCGILIEDRVQQPRTPILSHRSTVKIQEDLNGPHGRLFAPDEMDEPNLDTKLKIEIIFNIRTIRLSADVGGLSLRININSLDGKLNLEQLKLLDDVLLDNQNRVNLVNRYSVPTTRMGIDVKESG
jgi:hypothetical protein